jgi:O-antigen ligase
VIWESTLQTLPGRLVTGLGPGGSALVYPRYAPPWLTDFATNPHNAFLQLWSDAGVLGALAGLYALVAGLRLALLVRRLPREHTRFGLAIGLLGAVVGAAVHGTFESAISAVVTDPSGTYHYIVSPLPWYVAGLLWIVLSPLPRRAASDS